MSKKTRKKVVVDRRFLLDLARRIYDPKTRKFLRLCVGKLQNGPDPTDPTRPMHCGLGELYFAMTGWQPNSRLITEGDVISLAIELSTLPDSDEELKKNIVLTQKEIRKLKIPDFIMKQLLAVAEELDYDPEESSESLFYDALKEIPAQNDHSIGGDWDTCRIDFLRRRSQRVARQLRKAAKILPA